MLSILKTDRVHPPLYFALLKLWTFVFGGESAFNIRSFSLLFGVLLIPLSYLVVQQFHLEKQKKRFLGIFTAFVFAFSPFFITYSVEARSYSFLGFLALLSMFFFLRAMKNMYKPTKDLGFWLLTLLVIFFTHYLSILIVLGYFVAYILLVMLDKDWIYNKTLWRNITISLFIAWIAITFGWNALKLQTLVEGSNLGWIAQSDFSVLPRVLYAFLFGVDRQSPGMPPVNKFSFPLLPGNLGFFLLTLVIACSVVAIKKLAKKKEQLKDLLIIGSVGIIPILCIILASSLGLHLFVERYIIGYGIAFIMASMLVFWHLFDKKIIIGLGIYSVLLLFVVLPPQGHKYTDLTNYINTQNDKNLVFEDPGDFIVFKYFLPDTAKKVIVEYPGTNYGAWALINRTDETEVVDIPNNSLIMVWKYGGFEAPKEWKMINETPDHKFYVKE